MEYDKDGPFNDPVVRCTECQNLVTREEIKMLGMCPRCSNRRVRNVSTLSEKEMADLKTYNMDPDFLALFEGVEVE